jgi:uncharacterized protein with HEPN domain
MPKFALPDRLQHILDAISGIEEYTAGKSFADYRAQSLIRDAVERRIERLSEAVRFIPDDIRDKHPLIPWRNIAGVGNVLRHDYPDVNDDIVWRIVQEDLAPLRHAIESILTEASKTKET